MKKIKRSQKIILIYTAKYSQELSNRRNQVFETSLRSILMQKETSYRVIPEVFVDSNLLVSRA
jgi:hypothetical protein